MNELESTQSGFIRKTSEDKLTYKNIIADAINTCRRLQGYHEFRGSVQGLEKVIYMDIQGYRLTEKIDDIKKNLTNIGQEYINKLQKIMGRSEYYKNAHIAKLKIFMDQWYYEQLFEGIIQLLAEHNLLLETERLIPLRIGTDTDTDSDMDMDRP